MTSFGTGLAGVLHRTIHVANLADGTEEDAASMLAQRCGAVERWTRDVHDTDTDDVTLTIVFETMSSLATALQFDGMTFAGKKLAVWVANRPKPAAMLAIEQKAKNNTAAQTAARADIAEEDPEETQRKADAVKAALASLRGYQDRLKMGTAGGPLSSVPKRAVQLFSAEEKDTFLADHTVRQCRALTEITNHWCRTLHEEAARLQEAVVRGRDLLEALDHLKEGTAASVVAQIVAPPPPGPTVPATPQAESAAPKITVHTTVFGTASSAAPINVASAAALLLKGKHRKRRRHASTTSSSSTSPSPSRSRRKKHVPDRKKAKHSKKSPSKSRRKYRH